MSERLMQPADPNKGALMKAWTAYKATENYANSLYWATTEMQMREERAQELKVPPEANIATPEMQKQRVEGSLWAAFMAGFIAAGGKTS